MTRIPSNREGLHKADQKFLSDIEDYGWSVMNVHKKAGEEGPDWSFSTGIFFKFQHPEIIIFGLDSNTMTCIINNIGKEVESGKHFEPGREYSDLFERCLCMFRIVAQDHYRDYLGWAIWFYEQDPFPVLQCFWPDKNGFYPWDLRCDLHVRSAQPLLFKPS
jgi:hypothetical protein